jgi:hypothetical protein
MEKQLKGENMGTHLRPVFYIFLLWMFSLFFIPLQTNASMPTPSHEPITGCLVDDSFLLFKTFNNVLMGMDRFRLYTQKGEALNKEIYNGKIIKTTAAILDRRNRDIRLYGEKAGIEGDCLPFKLKGCVVDGKLFVTETAFGEIVIHHNVFAHSGYFPRPVALSGNGNSSINLTPFEKKMITVEGSEAKTDSSGFISVKIDEGKIETIGECRNIAPSPLRQSAEKYYASQAYGLIQKSDHKGAVKAMNLSQNYTDPGMPCAEYRSSYAMEQGMALGFETARYAYAYARCSGKSEILGELEEKFIRKKEFRYAAFTVALAADIEKNGEKKKTLLERFTSLVNRASKGR